ncbi:MAG: hypothetical protein WC319_14025, partial [Candidatus Paceibacterota bacterium]
ANLMEIYFVFFFPPRKKRRNPTHIAHIAKAPQANAATKALPKSAILPTHHNSKLRIKQLLLFDFQINNSQNSCQD